MGSRADQPRRRTGVLVRSRSRAVWLAGLLVLLLLAAGCGGAEDAGAGGGGTEEAEPAAETATGTAEESTAGGASASGDTAPNGYYEGELIEITSPFSAGGSTSLTAELMGRYLAEYLDTQVQVVFRDYGGEHRVGTNEWWNLPADGTNLLMSSGSTHTAAVYDIPGVEWEFDGMLPLAGFPLGLIIFAHPSTGFESASDVLEPAEPLYWAGRAPVGGDLQRTNAFQLLGMEVNELWGYEGRSDMQIAYEQGEVNLAGETTPAFLNCCAALVESGDAIPLFTLGNLDAEGNVVEDQAFPDLPTVAEVYEELYGEHPSTVGDQWEALKLQIATTVQFSKALWAHEGIPDEAREDLEWAVARVVEDPDFLADAEAELGGYDVWIGDELVAAADQYLAGYDQDAVDWLREWVKETYDVELE